MADGELTVVFHGTLTGAYPEETVKENLARQFAMPVERVEALFTGQPVVVKKNVDATTARKFQAAFEKAGAHCEIRSPGSDEPPAPGEPPRSKAGRNAVLDAGDPKGTVVALEAPADLGDLALDDSDTPLAPRRRASGAEIDTGGLKLADTDAPQPTHERPPVREIDTGGLCLEPLESTREPQ